MGNIGFTFACLGKVRDSPLALRALNSMVGTSKGMKGTKKRANDIKAQKIHRMFLIERSVFFLVDYKLTEQSKLESSCSKYPLGSYKPISPKVFMISFLQINEGRFEFAFYQIFLLELFFYFHNFETQLRKMKKLPWPAIHVVSLWPVHTRRIDNLAFQFLNGKY